jgi:hypothetical protein
MDLRWWVILVQVCVLVQCSVDPCIAEGMLQLVCSFGKKEGDLPFYISRVEPYRGYMFLDREREREIGSLGLSWWVLRRVMCSHTPGMASSITLGHVASPSLTSL